MDRPNRPKPFWAALGNGSRRSSAWTPRARLATCLQAAESGSCTTAATFWTANGRAVELGWGPLDLFGCDSLRPWARIDHQGLIWLLEGRGLADMLNDRAIIRTPSGGALTYYRRSPASDQVTPWMLAEQMGA